MIKGTEKVNRDIVHGEVLKELEAMKMHEVKDFPLFGNKGIVEVMRVQTGWIYNFSNGQQPIFVPSDRTFQVKIKGKW